MPYPQESELRSIRVEHLPKFADAIFLFDCFHYNNKVLAATVLSMWRPGLQENYGFVEFASHEDAKFVLESYNGELLPNLLYSRFWLSWDTDGFATRWRRDKFYRDHSFFGYGELGEELNYTAAVIKGLDSIGSDLQPSCSSTCKDSGEALPSCTEYQTDHAESKGLSPVGNMETACDEPFKITDMPLTDPNLYLQGYSGSSLTIQQNQPEPMQRNGATYVNQPHYLPPYQHGFYPQRYAYQPHYQQPYLPPLYPQPYAYQPPYQQPMAQWNVGSDAHTLWQLTQVPKVDLKMVSSMKKERELCLCFEEVNNQQSCYVLRTIKLSELLDCSCDIDIDPRTRTKCASCAPKTKLESQWRQRAWLYSGEKFPQIAGGKGERVPKGMGCLAYGSQMFLAGGCAPLSDAETTWEYLPTGDVYMFEPESTKWQKLDWSFLKVKPKPLLVEVNGNLYCFSLSPNSRSSEPPTFEVYNSSSRQCILLSEPQVDFPGIMDGRSLTGYVPVYRLACAVVGTKILISSRVGLKRRCIPIICFDVNDKEPKWRVMPSLFDGKPFPFDGRALVLDSNGAHVMFSFRGESFIYVSRLAVNVDTGDVSISDDKCLGVGKMMRYLMDKVDKLSYTFVDLGDQNVAFVLCGNVCSAGLNGLLFRKVCVVVVVMHYQVSGSKDVTSEIRGTRTFEYNCLHRYVGHTDLTCGFVF